MSTVTITSKGQITIPADIRVALDLSVGDKLIFVIEDERLIAVPVRKRTLDELCGSLPPTRPFIGHEEERRATGVEIGLAREQEGTE